MRAFFRTCSAGARHRRFSSSSACFALAFPALASAFLIIRTLENDERRQEMMRKADVRATSPFLIISARAPNAPSPLPVADPCLSANERE
jgi:hypothetical protein